MFPQDLGFRFIKILDIFYIALISLTIGYFVTIGIDELLPQFNKQEADKKTKIRNFIEIVFHLGLVAVLFYIIINIIELIPSPFEGIYGLEHKRNSFLRFSLLTTLIMFYQSNLRSKMTYFRERFNRDFGRIKKQQQAETTAQSNQNNPLI